MNPLIQFPGDPRLASMATDGIPRGVDAWLQARYRHDAMPADYERKVNEMTTKYEYDEWAKETAGEMGGSGIGEPITHRERPDVVKLLVWAGALAGSIVFWYAVAVIVYGLVTR